MTKYQTNILQLCTSGKGWHLVNSIENAFKKTCIFQGLFKAFMKWWALSRDPQVSASLNWHKGTRHEGDTARSVGRDMQSHWHHHMLSKLSFLCLLLLGLVFLSHFAAVLCAGEVQLWDAWWKEVLEQLVCSFVTFLRCLPEKKKKKNPSQR